MTFTFIDNVLLENSTSALKFVLFSAPELLPETADTLCYRIYCLSNLCECVAIFGVFLSPDIPPYE